MKYKSYDYPSMRILTAKTDKFKNCYIEINFREDIRNVDPASRVFLSQLMVYNSALYKTRRDLRIKQEELSNLELGCSCERNGFNLITTISIDFLDPKFINDASYLEKCLGFLLDIIKNPNINADTWELSAYEVIKERLHVAIDNYKESPSSFAKVNFLKELFKGEIPGRRLIDSHEQINFVTHKSLVGDYKEMIEKSFCEVSIIGNLDMEMISNKITSMFIKPMIITKEIPSYINNEPQKYHEIFSESKYTQTQVLMGYLLDELTYKERFYVIPIFNRIFGYGNLSDKLGKYLRMDNSLCYSYSTNFCLSDSYAFILTGIKKENISTTVSYIKKAFNEMSKKAFESSELETKKNQFLRELDLEQDNIYGIANHMYSHYIFDVPLYEEFKAGIMSVTKDDIATFTKKMHLTLLYVQKEEDNERN